MPKLYLNATSEAQSYKLHWRKPKSKQWVTASDCDTFILSSKYDDESKYFF